jgi:hypothetical protein
MRTVPLAKAQRPGAVDGDQRVSEQPAVVQNLPPPQALKHLPPQAVVGRGRHVA